MEQELRRHLLTLALAYAAHKECSITKVSCFASGDSGFLARIKTKSFTARSYDRVMTWFDRNWPEALPWPADVPRIIKSEAA